MNDLHKSILSEDKSTQHLIADRYYSGFRLAHDTYNAISVASNGKVYYILSSESIDVGGQMFVYDPNTDRVNHLGDLSEICGEKNKKSVPQGKSHVCFEEHNGKLYFATHIGYYELIDGMERLPVNVPEGYALYEGGHLVAYDLEQETFEDLTISPNGEGILTMTMDKEREVIYAITWPKGNFIAYDLKSDKLKTYGQISEGGEAGKPGEDYRVLCRSMFVDPADGKVYFSTAEGDIFFYSPASDTIQLLDGVDLKLDYFGSYKTNQPGSMAYNWRKIFWHPSEEVAYGVHGNSGYLFRFDPRNQTLALVKRITSEPSRKSGIYDQFSYGYLGFELAPDRDTIYYLSGGPIFKDGKRVEGAKSIAKGAAKGLENTHLITYTLSQEKYTDHGPVFYPNGERPSYVNAIAVGRNGQIFSLARFMHEGKTIHDLIKIDAIK